MFAGMARTAHPPLRQCDASHIVNCPAITALGKLWERRQPVSGEPANPGENARPFCDSAGPNRGFRQPQRDPHNAKLYLEDIEFEVIANEP